LGLDSLVGQYVNAKQEDAKEDYENTHYAELWMGTHPSSPCMVKVGENIKDFLSEEFYVLHNGKMVDLNEVIDAHKETFLNERITNMDFVSGSGALPFLFKILSVSTSLSIQAHPHKELAQLLHADYPDIYKDANHKPEMIIALTDYEALCSFSAGTDIHDRLQK
jgi:mannose-6-phosphate isomerase